MIIIYFNNPRVVHSYFFLFCHTIHFMHKHLTIQSSEQHNGFIVIPCNTGSIHTHCRDAFCWCSLVYIIKLVLFMMLTRSQGSSVSIETRQWTGWPGFNSWKGEWWELFFHYHIQTSTGPNQFSVQWVPESLTLGVKRPGLEANHSPPSGAEVKNACNHTSTSPICMSYGVVLN
jgi:hypothetical protein